MCTYINRDDLNLNDVAPGGDKYAQFSAVYVKLLIDGSQIDVIMMK